jgi:flagellar biosynthesis/type III secretory pathway chaperone
MEQLKNLQWLSDRMDAAFNALKEQRDLECEVNLLIKTCSSLLEKIDQRDKQILSLKSELLLIQNQLSAFVTVESVEGDE